MKRELSAMLTAGIARELKKRGTTQDDVDADFSAWRKARRATRRRR